MNCDSIKLISSIPFPYHKNSYLLPSSVLDEYIRVYRKELNNDNIISFLTYNDYELNKRLLYLMKIFNISLSDFKPIIKLSNDDIIKLYKGDLGLSHYIELLKSLTGNKNGNFNYDLSPDQIERMYSYKNLNKSDFIKLISKLTNNHEIFIGHDLEELKSPFESRSFKIFQTLY